VIFFHILYYVISIDMVLVASVTKLAEPKWVLLKSERDMAPTLLIPPPL